MRRTRRARLEDKIAQLERDKRELITAIRLTQEYARLPAVPGWSWYDALRRHDPQLLEQLVHPPKLEVDPADAVGYIREGDRT